MSDAISHEDRARFERQYRACRGVVRAHLVYLTGDPQLAEDLTQETFGRLYQRDLERGGDELRNPQAWLLTVASNLAYNHFRTESRRVARETSTHAVVASEAAPSPDVEAVLDVRRALGELGTRDRIVLLLRHSGFSYAEIAEAIDIAPGSVGTILARAQRRFRDVYEGALRGAVEKE